LIDQADTEHAHDRQYPDEAVEGGPVAKLPTISDVATRANVSRQTVSNVLNSPEIVLDGTRARVEQAIAELGYRPHESARRLRTRTSSTVGIRLDPESNGISGTVLDHYLHALAEQFSERGIRLTLLTARDDAAEIEQFQRLRDGADVDAVVLTGTSFRDSRIDWLVENGVPFVSFGRPWGSAFDDPAVPWVDVDGNAGTAEATRHLQGRGIRRIGFLGWPVSDWGSGSERRDGWAATMREAFGLTGTELEALTTTAEEGVPTARQAVERMLRAPEPPEALVCASDSLALGAMMAVREAGMPHFPVIGFDNSSVARAVGLSSVDQRLDEVAAATVEILMGRTGRRVLPHREGVGQPEPSAQSDAVARPDASVARHRLVTPKLVVRRSSHLAVVDEAGSTESGDHSRKEQQ
jgi:DNA-binding LacI/PurR family transcriptional regulator